MTLTNEPVLKTLFRMATPMLAGTIAMNTYNLVDTWFVARLGTLPLAAMGFTFPAVTLFTFIAGGIGTGVTTLTAHALGRNDLDNASRIVTHGILLTIGLSVCLSIIGYISIDAIFSTLGADKLVLPLVRDYMRIWYFGAVSMSLPMMGNGILLSLGDSKTASAFMVLGAGLNCLLDPLFIYGWKSIPGMGISGAALATVIAQATAALWLIWLLSVKHRLLHLLSPKLFFFPDSCRRIMRFAVPSILSLILMPLSTGVITAIISTHGNTAVAAVSAAGRVEMFAFIIPMALGMSLVPFVGRNFGAKRNDRIREAKTYSYRFAFIYGIGIAILFSIQAPVLARFFSTDTEVIHIFITYMRIVSWGFGMMEIHRYCGFFLTGIHRPVMSTLLNVTRTLVLLIPLAMIGNTCGGIKGIFTGRLITDFSAAVVGFIVVSRLLHHHKEE